VEGPAPPGAWRGEAVDPADLRCDAGAVVASLDCTGGWFSEQSWDAVPVAALLGDGSARSIRVVSTTGYSRLFPFGDTRNIHLAVGYGGEPLRLGHGAPVRLVAPGRRGPWWVEWVGRTQHALCGWSDSVTDCGPFGVARSGRMHPGGSHMSNEDLVGRSMYVIDQLLLGRHSHQPVVASR
jgi:hypothetical protein